ncbi:MAG: hypothetical protein LBB45_00190 [Methanobrevibacter sp.]|jgi:RNA-directed DNA polymerase|nr:hypothetical protein [Candidatus Methanovirga basalitermitum]
MEKILNITYREDTGKYGYVHYETEGKYRMLRYADDFVIFAKNKEDIKAI